MSIDSANSLKPCFVFCYFYRKGRMDSGAHAAPSGAEAMAGKMIGNFRVSGLLGQGGMGAVYRAEHPELGLQVAIKVLDRRLLAHPGATERFLTEARAATHIDHPAVIRIQDFGQLDDGGLYYVMEALSGRDLGSLIDGGERMAPREVLEVLEQVCPALQKAHDMGIVHRDLKPTNLFLLDTDPIQFKVLDFGIAKLLQAQHPEDGMSSAGIVMGTPQYVAPEQAAGQSEDIGPCTDIYSMGVIIYQLLSGRLPIVARKPTTLLYKQINSPPISLREVLPDVPLPVARVVHRCLDKDPACRPPGAGALLRDFRRALSGAEDRGERVLRPSVAGTAAGDCLTRPTIEPVARLEADPDPAAAVRFRPRWSLAALILVSVLLAGVTYFVLHRSSGPSGAGAGQGLSPVASSSSAALPVEAHAPISRPTIDASAPDSGAAGRPAVRRPPSRLPPTIRKVKKPTKPRTKDRGSGAAPVPPAPAEKSDVYTEL